MNHSTGKIWITGAGGMLGQDLCRIAVESGWQISATDREIDITDASAVTTHLENIRPQVVINCAAYTAVDKAESESELNRRINTEGPAILGTCTARYNIGVIHISTDYVLSGAPPEPLREDAPYAPLNAYGRTKATGEQALIAANPLHWIVRTAWLYGLQGPNFVKTMLRLMAEKEQLTVVEDQLGNPTWTEDLCRALLAIAASGQAPGIYHYSGDGITSWHGFATVIQQKALALGLLTRSVPVHPVPSSAYPTPAQRPFWSALDKTRIRSTFGVTSPPWQDSLQRYLEQEKASRA